MHPLISAPAAYCGYDGRIPIADGNYLLKAKCPQARKTFPGLEPGLPFVTEALEALLSETNVEAAEKKVRLAVSTRKKRTFANIPIIAGVA